MAPRKVYWWATESECQVCLGKIYEGQEYEMNEAEGIVKHQTCKEVEDGQAI